MTVEVDMVVCRACTMESDKYKSLFQSGVILGEITNLASILNYCIYEDFIKEEDELPNNICQECIKSLTKAYTFKKLVMDSNNAFRAAEKSLSTNCIKEDVIGEAEVAEEDEEATRFDYTEEEGGVLKSEEYIEAEEVEMVEVIDEGEGAEEEEEEEQTDNVQEVEVDELGVVELPEIAEEVEQSDVIELAESVDGVEETGSVVQTQYVTEDLETAELHDLGITEQMKHDMENMGFVSLSVIGEQSDEELCESQNEERLDLDDEEAKELILRELTEEVDTECLQYELSNTKEELTSTVFETYEITVIGDSIETANVPLKPVKDKKARVRKRPLVYRNDEDEGDIKSKVPRTPVKRRSSKEKPVIPELQCQVCNKQLSNLNSFKYHMQLHSDATPFLCSLCGEGFKTRNAYEGHIVVHDPNNPNTCDLCGKSYRQASSLRSHMLTHTGEKPYQCDICGKGMTQKSGYKKHMLVHTGEKPHSCDICGRDFRYSSNLNAHKRCHTGEKPYMCANCEKCFMTQEQLKRHSLVHNLERPFSCDLCDKTFKRRSSLLTHKHSHQMRETLLIDAKLSRTNVVELY